MVSLDQQEGPGENAFFIKNLHRHSSRMWKKSEKVEKKVPKISHPFWKNEPAGAKKSKMGQNGMLFFGFFTKMTKNDPKIGL